MVIRFHCLLCFLFLSSFLTAQSFEDVASAHGITKSFGNGLYGGGISFVDFNMDGWDDLTFATAQGDSVLFYQNNQGVFSKIPALIPHTAHARQVIWVDYDNDGDRDLFVSTGFGANHLYQNDGTMKLTDVTTQVGLPSDVADSFGAHFGDINNDGWLDLYVLNRHQQTHYNYLYLFDGTTFTDITHSSGLKYGPHMSFVSAFFDYNKDGFQDIYIAEDKYFGNKLFENNGDTTFTEISVATNCYYEMDAMNVGIGDPNLDGWPDIYITNTPASINPESKLLINIAGVDFDEVALEMNISYPNRTGWCANWLDYDNDSDEDLYACSSFALPIPTNPSNALYINEDTIFIETNLPNDDKKSYCNAVGDFNQDGLLDIAVSHADSIFSLFQNMGNDSLHWLKIQLEGSTSNKEGIGSQVEVWADSLKQTRWVLCGEAYLAQNSFIQHFGMDTLTQIDSLKITWLGGQEDWYYDLAVDSTYAFIQKTSILPIELIAFDAKKDGNRAMITWAVAQQSKPSSIVLQRSTDGQLFKTIAQFDTNVDSQNTFSYLDESIQAQQYYYRLALVELDGSVQYSAIRSVTFEPTSNISVHPTLLANEDLTIQSLEKNIQSIKIIDSNGQELLTRAYKKATKQVALAPFIQQKGVYYVVVTLYSSEVITHKIVKI